MGKINQSMGITGASGFVGSHLTTMMNARKIAYNVFRGNLLNKKDITSYCKKYHPEIIIHLAGLVDGNYKQLFEANVLTTANLLEIGMKHNLKKIIFASTGAVYGGAVPKNGAKENDKLKPSNYYGLSKLQAEECIKYFNLTQGLKYIILRFSSIYGPGNNKGALYNLNKSIKDHRQVKIYGSGKQTRQLLHVEDACRAILLTLNRKTSEIFNVGSVKNYSLIQTVKLLKKKYQFSVKYLPANNNLMHLRLDQTKARRILKFVPKYKELII